MTRILLSGGMVADGTGAPLRQLDVLINGPVIENVLAPETLIENVEEIDCTGAVVAPGFIDRHTHSDLSALAHPNADSKLAQGVTTEVTGNCGFSPFPLASGNAAEILKEASVWHIDVDWTDAASYRRKLSDAGMAINRFPLVGHGVMRAVISSYEDRPLTAEELPTLERLTEEALNGGARGVSAGLIYPPGCFSDTPELVRVAKVAARRNVSMAFHIRGEGSRLEQAVQEVIDIITKPVGEQE